MRRVAVLGKGTLAVHACEILAELPGIVLDTVIPTTPEPGWDISLTDTVTTRWPDVRVLGSGDWRDLEPGRCDLVLSVLYDKIIGPELIDATPQIINCHPGRLPQYRGVRPVNWALRNGDDLAGITLHVIDDGVDSGPILAEALFSIWPEVDEVRDVWWRAIAHGRQLLTDALPLLDQIVPRPQDPALAVTHYSRDNHQLGDRADWTRAQSTFPAA
ncbi:formyltransferase family protein [Amycolatopsis sp., V23-08]|uniref:Formyltransferase family protein n=1 Tax=Amycolatopsis heterodermiae TaxID=3110235 RepID=A0ABU5RLL1_9PSEU|nr:formyltransferase family protein [Amycolatopsis sp., V23-08]MEA5367186.1 formyltransferase family protein [Amycolatopsis sp., V23-08]